MKCVFNDYDEINLPRFVLGMYSLVVDTCFIGYTTDATDSTILNVNIELDGKLVFTGCIYSDFMHDVKKVNLDLGVGYHSMEVLMERLMIYP